MRASKHLMTSYGCGRRHGENIIRPLLPTLGNGNQENENVEYEGSQMAKEHGGHNALKRKSIVEPRISQSSSVTIAKKKEQQNI